MILKPNIRNAFSRKVCCVILILFISISFSFSGALAKNCKGGPDCLNCVKLAHPHVPGEMADNVAGQMADMQNHGCGSGQKDGTCSFEAGRSPDEFHGIVSAARPDNHEFSGIFTAGPEGVGQSYLSGEIISPILSPDSGKKTPIYLLHQSLLC
jgi:hypothetical protein